MNKHSITRVFLAAVIAVSAMAAMALPAQAGREKPLQVNKFKESFEEPFAAEDFESICGLDNLQAILSAKGRDVEYENGFSFHVNFRLVWTNLDTGQKVVLSWAENTEIRFTIEVIDGVETIHETQRSRGLWEKWHAPGVGVIARDAGQVTFDRTIMFDAETGEFLGFEESFATNGPFPLLDAGGPFPMYGDAICGALGGTFSPELPV